MEEGGHRKGAFVWKKGDTEKEHLLGKIKWVKFLYLLEKSTVLGDLEGLIG